MIKKFWVLIIVFYSPLFIEQNILSADISDILESYEDDGNSTQDEAEDWSLSDNQEIQNLVKQAWDLYHVQAEDSLSKTKEKFALLFKKARAIDLDRFDFDAAVREVYETKTPHGERFCDQLEKWWVEFEIIEHLDEAKKLFSKNRNKAQEAAQEAYKLAKQGFFSIKTVLRWIEQRYSDSSQFSNWAQQQVNPPKEIHLTAWKKLYEQFADVALNREVQALQRSLVEQREVEPPLRVRTLVQLKSIDQFSPEVGQGELDCGFFAVYNSKKLKNILLKEGVSALQKYKLTTPTSNLLGTITEVKRWLPIEREKIITKYKNALQERVRKAQGLALHKDMHKQYEQEKKSLQTQYDIKLDIPTEINQKIKEYAQRQVNFLALGDVLYLLQENNLDHATVLQPLVTDLLGGGEQTLQNTLLNYPLQTLIDFGYAEFLNMLKKFRATGQAQYFIVNPRDHYIMVVLTKEGMYLADSERNQDRLHDVNIQTLYDFCLLATLPEEELPENNQELQQSFMHLTRALRRLEGILRKLS